MRKQAATKEQEPAKRYTDKPVLYTVHRTQETHHTIMEAAISLDAPILDCTRHGELISMGAELSENRRGKKPGDKPKCLYYRQYEWSPDHLNHLTNSWYGATAFDAGLEFMTEVRERHIKDGKQSDAFILMCNCSDPICNLTSIADRLHQAGYAIEPLKLISE